MSVKAPVQEIGREECLRLLAGDEIGRLAVVAGNTPIVVPVNDALDGESVVPDRVTGRRVTAGERS